MLRRIDSQIFDYVEQNGVITSGVIIAFLNGDNKPLRADKGTNFTAYASDLLEKQYARKKIRISTYKNSVTIINQFRKFMDSNNISEIFIGDITENLVRDFIAWGLERGRKTVTIEKYLETVCKICRQATADGLLPKESLQAIADITLGKSIDDNTHRKIKYLSTNETCKLVKLGYKFANRKQNASLDMFLFAYYACGMRISDIITLRWCDIDLNKKELDKIQVKTRGRNIIPLKDEALEILHRWQGLHEVFVFGLLPDDFNLKDEEMLRTRRNSITSAINKRLQGISENAQLDKKVTFHMARHSWAVTALEQGMSISMISSLLGHTSSAITEKVYAEFRQGTKIDAVRNLKFDFEYIAQ
jgi:integrase